MRDVGSLSPELSISDRNIVCFQCLSKFFSKHWQLCGGMSSKSLSITSIMQARKSEKRRRLSVFFSCGNAAQACAHFVTLLDDGSSSSDESAASDWLSSSSVSEFDSDCDEGPHSEQVICVENVECDKYFVFHIVCFQL